MKEVISMSAGVDGGPYRALDSKVELRRDKLLDALFSMSNELSHLSKTVRPQPQTIHDMLESVQQNVTEQLDNNVSTIRSLSESINVTLVSFEEGLNKQAELSDEHGGSINTVNTTLLTLKNAIESLKGQMEVIQQLLTKQTETSSRYSEKINTASQTMNELVKELRKIDSENAARSSGALGAGGAPTSIPKIEKSLNGLLETVRQMNTNITSLERLSSMSSSIDEIKIAVKSSLSYKQVEALNKLLLDQNKEQNGLLRSDNAMIKESLEQIKSLQQVFLDKQGEENKQLIEDHAKALADAMTLKATVDDLKEQLKNKDDQLVTIRQRLQDSATQTNRTYQESIASLEKKINEQNTTIASLERKIDDRDAMVDRMAKETILSAKKHEDDLQSLEDRIKNKEEEIANLMAQIDDLELREQALQEELEVRNVEKEESPSDEEKESNDE